MLCAICKGIEFRCVEEWHHAARESIQRYIDKTAISQLSHAAYNPPVEVTATGTLFYVHHQSLQLLETSALLAHEDSDGDSLVLRHDTVQQKGAPGCEFCKMIFDILKSGDAWDLPYSSGTWLRDRELEGLSEILLCLEMKDGNILPRCLPYLQPDHVIDVRMGGSRLQVAALNIPGNYSPCHDATNNNIGRLEEISAVTQCEQVTLEDSIPASMPINLWNSQEVLAKYWLKTCSEVHEKCKSIQSPDPHLPTRILHVGVKGEEEKVHLHVSNAKEKDTYVTLSHCWGTHQIITTTTKNIESHQREVPIQDLSRTFQDAVVATRNLGVKYLWIDSLCIIQDSPADWAAESEKMHQIYRDAAFCISAVGAIDGNVGLFPEGTKMVRPCKMEMSFDHGRPVFLTPNKSILASGPLFNRTWVLQEQCLSIRSLQFAKDGLYWSCRTHGASERMPLGDPWARNRFLEDNEPIETFNITSGGSINDLSEQGVRPAYKAKQIRLLDFWYSDVVPQAAQRKLTYDTDRLAAIVGLAKQIMNLPGFECTYRFGLWEEDLAHGLLWRGGHQSTRRRPPQTFVAPSWSWASVSNNGGFYGSLETRVSGRHLIKDTDVAFEVTAGNQNGLSAECAYGVVRANGKLKPVRWIPRLWSYYRNTFESKVEDNMSRGGSAVDLDGNFIGRSSVDDASDTPAADAQVWCWPVLQNILSQEEETLVCLLLRPLSVENDGQKFVKIGEIATRRLDWFDDVESTQFLLF
jgi:hypothetical protein